jgi:type III secretion protein C
LKVWENVAPSVPETDPNKSASEPTAAISNSDGKSSKDASEDVKVWGNVAASVPETDPNKSASKPTAAIPSEKTTAVAEENSKVFSFPFFSDPKEVEHLGKKNKTSSRRSVVGDSDVPIIDLGAVQTVDSMVFAEGDPADHLPWRTAEYYHFAKNQELKELVRSFCTMQSMDAVVSDTVEDVVNGKFSNVTPYQFWKDIVNAYGLVWFFDGSMMYVYKSSEVKSTVFKMNRDEMRTLVKVIAQLGWLSSNVTFRPLETAGILVVSGPPKLMSLIEELSKKIVIERVSNIYDIRSFPLKHAWAYNMSVNYRGGNMNIPGVAIMLQQIISTLPGPIGESDMGVNIDNSKANESTSVKPIAGTVYHSNENGKPNSGAKDKNSDSKNKEENSGKDKKDPLSLSEIFVTHDTRLNAVIVKAKRQDMGFIENIIQQLDVPRNAIKIEVAVVDISKSGAINIGSKFIVNRRNRDGAANAAAGNSELISSDYTKGGSSSITMNFDKLFRGYSLAETLSILEDVGNAQTLTRSSVITLDNIGAVIDRSNTAYVPVTGAKAGGLYDVTVSTKLVVVPHIIPGEFDGNGCPKIKLLIEVTDGSFDKDPRTNVSGPATSTSSVNTEASIFEGQSLFIGGYFHETHSVNSAGIPFLKDIPLLGHLFKMSGRDNSIVERIYIITPTVVRIDDPKTTQLNRFFTDGQLAGESTLKPDEFILTNAYEKPSFEKATYKPKETGWRMPQKNIPEFQKLSPKEIAEKRSRMKSCRH